MPVNRLLRSVVIGLLAAAGWMVSAGAWGQGAAVTVEGRPRPVPPRALIAPLACTDQAESGRAFCQAYNSAIAECADKRAAADIRACFAARMPAAPAPSCPPSGAPGVSSTDQASCEQHAIRDAACRGLVGEANLACLRARTPVALERTAPVTPAPVGSVLPVAPVASSGGAAPTGLPPLPPILPMVPPGSTAGAVPAPPPPLNAPSMEGVRP